MAKAEGRLSQALEQQRKANEAHATAHSDVTRLQQRVADAERDKKDAEDKVAAQAQPAEEKTAQEDREEEAPVCEAQPTDPHAFFRCFEDAVQQQYQSAIAFLPALRSLIASFDQSAANANQQTPAGGPTIQQQTIVDKIAQNNAAMNPIVGEVPASSSGSKDTAGAGAQGTAPADDLKIQEIIVETKKSLGEVINPSHRMKEKTKVVHDKKGNQE